MSLWAVPADASLSMLRVLAQAALDSIPECHSFSLHTCEVDIDGMQTTRGS
eukprot:COSAG01_NODE_5779_length_4036_cov_256.771654_3_plen_51_part_00